MIGDLFASTTPVTAGDRLALARKILPLVLAYPRLAASDECRRPAAASRKLWPTQAPLPTRVFGLYGRHA